MESHDSTCNHIYSYIWCGMPYSIYDKNYHTGDVIEYSLEYICTAMQTTILYHLSLEIFDVTSNRHSCESVAGKP